YYHQGQRDLALQDFQVAAASPGSFAYEPRAMFWQGIILAERGEHSDAIRAYTRALANQPQFMSALMNRGLAYMNLGRFDQAEEDFNVILRKDPDNANARRYRDLAATRK
ncbi:MAG: tetratricopeptide repeat protein, partial [Planctomycetales bacterium]|nr:tetratricopeptide repeat protein [Planctomycetales bacterium]